MQEKIKAKRLLDAEAALEAKQNKMAAERNAAMSESDVNDEASKLLEEKFGNTLDDDNSP